VLQVVGGALERSEIVAQRARNRFFQPVLGRVLSSFQGIPCLFAIMETVTWCVN
jgi:hypothetical protein